ncbi:MAG: sigma 54-interacting transcriptional regulator [Candidatus Krumholzibacteriia bacterium]
MGLPERGRRRVHRRRAAADPGDESGRPQGGRTPARTGAGAPLPRRPAAEHLPRGMRPAGRARGPGSRSSTGRPTSCIAMDAARRPSSRPRFCATARAATSAASRPSAISPASGATATATPTTCRSTASSPWTPACVRSWSCCPPWPAARAASCSPARPAPARACSPAPLHDLSPRRRHPFVTVNCAALPENLLESELFGYRAGAFTGASRDRPGRIATAEGGTLFLDEVGDIPLPMQVKLLRFLQDRSYERLGDVTPHTANVRVVVATHRELAELVSRGEFRQDLYYRINVINLKLPALRKRPADIPLLVERFLEQFSNRRGKQVTGVTAEVLEALQDLEYRGNVRELEASSSMHTCSARARRWNSTTCRLGSWTPAAPRVPGPCRRRRLRSCARNSPATAGTGRRPRPPSASTAPPCSASCGICGSNSRTWMVATAVARRTRPMSSRNASP